LFEKATYGQSSFYIDNVIVEETSNSTSNYYFADVIDASDYSPFGAPLANRSYTAPNSDYRFGFNGKEMDNEVQGGGNSYDFGERIYSSRLGRWLSSDKLFMEAPSWTPYRAFFNNPIYWVDNDGNIEWPLKGNQAVNKKDAPSGGYGLKNTIVRTSTYMDTDRPPGATNPHIGIDYRASINTPFYSLADGKVVDIGKTKKGAKYITVEYGNGDKIRFLHIKGLADGIEKGDKVYEGQALGYTGKTGTKHPHLHVDGVDANGERIDPENMNYGNYTNEEFFKDYGGDYKKLPTYSGGDNEVKKDLFATETNKQDNTYVDIDPPPVMQNDGKKPN
jgi:RHS repeat-associated protein